MPKRKDNVVEKRRRSLKWLVRATAALVCFLLVLFFGTVLQTSRSIDAEVEHVKLGPYPVSVAAGHIETDLLRLKTVLDHISVSPVGLDPQYEQTYANTFREVSEDMDKQFEVLDTSHMESPVKLRQLHNEYELLELRMTALQKMCWGEDPREVTFETVSSFVQTKLIPVVNYLIDLNNDVIESTTVQINEMYDQVNDSLKEMFVFSLAVMFSVVAMIIVYMLLLHQLTRYESALRDSLEDALQKAQSADAAKSEFLSNMSHDIRTPMNAIVGLTTIAQESIDDKLRVKQCLTRISTSSQHLLSLINDVLDMNKIESGKVTLSRETFSIKALVDEIATIVESQPSSKKRNCTIKVDSNVKHYCLVGDTMRLRQVMLNLMSNALKYTNDGDSVRMTIGENVQPDPQHASFTLIVGDTGIGMSRDFVENIFNPFERERNDFTIFTEGTGLGMTITKNIVDLMGGTIEIESELGVGTVVTITIVFEIAPRGDCDGDCVPEPEPNRDGAIGFRERGDHEKHRDGESSRDAEPNSPVPIGSAGDGKVSGRVLVVEDNEINMEIAKQLISMRGAEVDEAVDGLDAYMKVSDSPEGRYDLIFMDWQMPNMNGIEATKAIRKFFAEQGRKEVPIVAMTANAFESDREEALAAGMVDFMAKPIDVHKLEEVLHTYIGDGDADVSDSDVVDVVADANTANADADTETEGASK